MQKCIIKSRWQTIQEQRKLEEKKALEELGINVVDEASENSNKVEGIDFRNIRPTDFKNNKRVVLPDINDDTEEIRRNNIKTELRKIVINYKDNYCDRSGNVLDNNMTKSQLKGIKNLKFRMKDENLDCGETDKTGRLTLDTLENMSKKMENHIKDDKLLNEKEVKKVENNLNRHMEFWAKILKPGEKVNKVRRVKSNYITKDYQIPVLRGCSKDHKDAVDAKVGHDFRPIMGATVGPNMGLSEVGSLIVRKIADNADIGLAAKSTEEVITSLRNLTKADLNEYQD